MFTHTDIFATFAELLGVDLDKSYPGSAEDNHSFLPALFEPAEIFPHPVMVDSMKCIRIDDWRLVDNPKGKGKAVMNQSYYEVHELEDGPSETTDVPSENRQRKLQLVRLFEEFIASRRLKPGAN